MQDTDPLFEKKEPISEPKACHVNPSQRGWSNVGHWSTDFLVLSTRTKEEESVPLPQKEAGGRFIKDMRREREKKGHRVRTIDIYIY